MKRQIVRTVKLCKSAKEVATTLAGFGAKWVSSFSEGPNGINPDLCIPSKVTTTVKANIGGRIYAFCVDSANNILYFG